MEILPAQAVQTLYQGPGAVTKVLGLLPRTWSCYQGPGAVSVTKDLGLLPRSWGCYQGPGAFGTPRVFPAASASFGYTSRP